MKSTNGKGTRNGVLAAVPASPESNGQFNAADAEVLRLVGQHKRVLELGCGAGHLARALGQQGCAVVGIEISAQLAKAASAVCERVIVGDLDRLDFVNEIGQDRFDVVLASDVLAHLKDPLLVLRAVKELLTPSGHVVVSLPNVAHISIRLALLGGNFPYAETGLLDRARLRFLTRDSIEKLMEDADLAIAGFERIIKTPDDPAQFEVPFDPAIVPSALLEGISRDPEALTYQFVLSAYPLPSSSLALLRDRIKHLTRETEAARNEAARLRSTLREAEERLETGKKELAEARREIQLDHDSTKASAGPAASTSEKAVVIAEHDWMKAEIGRMEDAWNQAQEEAQSLARRLAAVADEKAILEEQVGTLLAERQSLKAEIGCLQETFTHSEGMLEMTQAEVQQREHEADEQHRRIAGLEAQVKTLLIREKDLRDMLLEAHDQMLRRDEEIVMTLASALPQTAAPPPAPAAVPAQPAAPPAVAAQAATPPSTAAPAPPPSAPAGGKYLQYQQLILRIREAVRKHMPEGGDVLVVSRGDDDLLRLDPCRGAHFPQRDDGVYAGYHPADGAVAIDHLKQLQNRGAQFFLIPQTALWWLDHYNDLGDYLKKNAERVIDDPETCILFRLTDITDKFVRRIPAQQRAAAPPRPFGVNIAGYLTSEKGVGEAVRGQARSLLATGVPVVLNNLVDDTSANVVDECTSFSDDNPYGVNLIHLNADALMDFVDMRDKEYFHNRYNIGFWAWETLKFPSIWWDRFQCLDEIWVGSDFVLDAISRVSPIPVVKTPLAAPIRASLGPAARSRFDLNKKTFVFLFVFDYMSIYQRKNPMAAVQAFRKAFSTKDDAVLVLKCSHSHAYPEQARLLAKACKGANIKIIDTVISRPDLNALMNSADCYVSLHRSEGFGLTMAESMSLGKPVIATGYSGNMEFMTPANSFLVKYKLVDIADAGPYRDGAWADPDIDHAAELMRLVFKNRDAAKEVGKRARADMLRAFSPIAVGARMRDRLLRIAATGIVAPPPEPAPGPAARSKRQTQTPGRGGK